MFRVEDGVAVVTFNRPEGANAMGDDMTPFLRHQLHILKDDPDVRCLVLTGAGRAFSAGGNMMGSDSSGPKPEPPPLPPAPDGWTPDPDDERGRFKQMQRTVTGALWNFPVPTIAALPGAAAGMGTAMALACDMRVADEERGFVTAGYLLRGISMSTCPHSF